MKTIAGFIVGLIILIGLGWLFAGNSLLMYKVFAPAQEQARREVFEQSKAFNQGMIQELQNMQLEYIKASPEHKPALAAIILHRVADYDMDKMPANLRSFVAKLKSERTNY